MHTNSQLYKYHKFHHKFDKVLIPSIGNAVGAVEFLSAYILPFIISVFILKPTEVTFIIPITLISIFNLIIHCRELKHIRLGKYLIDTEKHMTHHIERDKHYAAPILDLDVILDRHVFKRYKSER